MAHAFNPSTEEAEAGRSEFKASLIYTETTKCISASLII